MTVTVSQPTNMCISGKGLIWENTAVALDRFVQKECLCAKILLIITAPLNYSIFDGNNNIVILLSLLFSQEFYLSLFNFFLDVFRHPVLAKPENFRRPLCSFCVLQCLPVCHSSVVCYGQRDQHSRDYQLFCGTSYRNLENQQSC